MRSEQKVRFADHKRNSRVFTEPQGVEGPLVSVSFILYNAGGTILLYFLDSRIVTLKWRGALRITFELAAQTVTKRSAGMSSTFGDIHRSNRLDVSISTHHREWALTSSDCECEKYEVVM